MILGADLSYVNAIEENGGIYRDSLGNKIDVFEHISASGTNLVRVRLWHTPSWQEALYGKIKYHNLSDVSKTVQRAKDQGMAVCLDLHYSDNWADPSKQETPQAWKNLPLNKIADSIYRHTEAALNHLKGQSLTPEYIQIGNETNGGMCYPLGKINGNNFDNFNLLIKAGIKAVRDFSKGSTIKPKIILHVAQFQNAEYWLSGVADKQDFDIIGISHYYKWSDIKSMAEVTSSIRDIKQKYNKDVLIMETAFPWTTQNADNYTNILSAEGIPSEYSVSPLGQFNYMKDLTQAVIDGGGLGLIYWEPCWITSNLKDQWGVGSSWENNAFYDFTGKALPVLNYMQQEYKF